MQTETKEAHSPYPSHTKPDRVRRACDKCNVSRTRCNGELPCRRCENLNYSCHYDRTVKKRGPKPKCSRQPRRPSCHRGQKAELAQATSPTCASKSPTPGIPEYPFSLDPQFEGINWDSLYFNTSTPSSDFSDCDIPPFTANFGLSHPDSLYTSAYNASLDLSIRNANYEYADVFPGCRYPCLYPVLQLLQGTLSPTDACDLLDTFFMDPGCSFLSVHCPYVLSPVIRKPSLLATNPRPTSPALLVIILWCVSHTSNLEVFQCPGARNRITLRLYSLSMTLLRTRESDSCCSVPEREQIPSFHSDSTEEDLSLPISNSPNVDDVLSYVLLTCVISGSEFKSESLKWWNKAVLLVKQLGYHSEARISARTHPTQQMTLSAREEHEECRRVFWLVYALDRHLALSFNEPLRISDSECHVLAPLPEWIWQNLDIIPLEDIPPRVSGPGTHVAGTGFFDYFLPLMAILGDIIDFRFRSHHPRLGGFDDAHTVSAIEASLAECEYSMEVFRTASEKPPDVLSTHDPTKIAFDLHTTENGVELVIAYSRYMLRVLSILLHGKWDAISTLEDNRSWIKSPSFLSCTSNSIAASDAISHILEVDTNLSFIPFVFGIYLFHGSLPFLLFADRMALSGPNTGIKQACDIVIRAHEISVVTFNTEFQELLSRFKVNPPRHPLPAVNGL